MLLYSCSGLVSLTGGIAKLVSLEAQLLAFYSHAIQTKPANRGQSRKVKGLSEWEPAKYRHYQ